MAKQRRLAIVPLACGLVIGTAIVAGATGAFLSGTLGPLDASDCTSGLINVGSPTYADRLDESGTIVEVGGRPSEVVLAGFEAWKTKERGSATRTGSPFSSDEAMVMDYELGPDQAKARIILERVPSGWRIDEIQECES